MPNPLCVQKSQLYPPARHGLELRPRHQHAPCEVWRRRPFPAIQNHPFSADAPQQTRSYPRNSSGFKARPPPTSPRHLSPAGYNYTLRAVRDQIGIPAECGYEHKTRAANAFRSRPVRHGPRPAKTPCAPRATRSAAEDAAAPRPRITATPSETRASSAAPAPPRRNMLCYPHAAAGPKTPRRPPPRLPPRRCATLTAWATALARPAACSSGRTASPRPPS
jgi:hypothetical protein